MSVHMFDFCTHICSFKLHLTTILCSLSALLGENIHSIDEKWCHYDVSTIFVRHGKGHVPSHPCTETGWHQGWDKYSDMEPNTNTNTFVHDQINTNTNTGNFWGIKYKYKYRHLKYNYKYKYRIAIFIAIKFMWAVHAMCYLTDNVGYMYPYKQLPVVR